MKKLLFLFLLYTASSCAQPTPSISSESCSEYFRAFSQTKQSLISDGILQDTTAAAFRQLALKIQSPNDWALNRIDLPDLPEEGLFKCTGTMKDQEAFTGKLVKIFDRIEQTGDLSAKVIVTGFIDIFSEEDWEHPFVQHGFLSMMNVLISDNRGLDIKLPPWAEEEPDISKLKSRNVWTVMVDNQNKIYIRDELVTLNQIRSMTRAFIANPDQDPELAESPKKAIVALRNDRGTNYKTYLDVYNELKAAYNELWEEKSQELFSQSYEKLSSDQRKEVRSLIPLVISEAEPTDFD